jgi:hypothetical protein
MDDRTGSDEHTLSLRLELHLDREPISGRLRTDAGAEERFVGWLGFVDALKRLHELEVDREPHEHFAMPGTRGVGPNRKEPR